MPKPKRRRSSFRGIRTVQRRSGRWWEPRGPEPGPLPQVDRNSSVEGPLYRMTDHRCHMLSYYRKLRVPFLIALATAALGSISTLGCSTTPASVPIGRDSLKASSPRTAHGRDSVAIVTAASAAYHRASTCCAWGLDVRKFQPSDSGYLVELQPVQPRDSTVSMFGGGGTIFVSRRGQARIVELFR